MYFYNQKWMLQNGFKMKCTLIYQFYCTVLKQSLVYAYVLDICRYIGAPWPDTFIGCRLRSRFIEIFP